MFLTSGLGPSPFTKAIHAASAGGSLGSFWSHALAAWMAKRTTGLGTKWGVIFTHGVTP